MTEHNSIRYTRDRAAAFLTEQGYQISKHTLASMAVRGGGPPFSKWGGRPLYTGNDLLDWARERCGPKVRTTSELDTAPPAAA